MHSDKKKTKNNTISSMEFNTFMNKPKKSKKEEADEKRFGKKILHFI